MTPGEALYTPEILGLATGLSDYAWDEELPLTGSARSRSCGSTISLALSTDGEGRVERIAIRSQACAIGQASAAIFARGARGRTAAEIRDFRDAIAAWLGGSGPIPNWPGIAAIERAKDYPGRHGAIQLAWQAASEALSSAPMPR